MKNPLRTVFRIASFAAVAAALLHFASMLSRNISRIEYEPGYPQWRHVVFIGINVILAWLFQVRPRWFIWVHGTLTAQVLYSHGWGAYRLWLGDGRVDWMSVAVSIGAPFLLIALILDRHAT
ncbi:hypothetical protein ARNL5_00114 [Anaerolineae bacterium]|nr:hypothetical protein ARNL5_00114 [Anaerolineae bacterium]